MGLFKRLGIILLISLLASLLVFLVWQQNGRVYAQDDPVEEPGRVIEMNVDFTVYEWWLLRWSNNQIVCQVFTEQEGLPNGAEIQYYCGSTINTEWQNSEPCDYPAEGVQECPGLYLHFGGMSQNQRTVEIELPMPQVWLDLEGCDLSTAENSCDSTPYLVLRGEEPLPNEDIIRIQGRFGENTFSCQGNQCKIPLQPSGPYGETLDFWADSSYGDSSQIFSALIRVVPQGDFMAPEGETQDDALWYVDILSSQWEGEAPPSCSEVWEVFPDVGGPSPWLTSPLNEEDLASAIPYQLLAGMLINSGTVDASDCPDGGMYDFKTASECGLQRAMEKVTEWQNLFDSEILSVSEETGIPAQLLKNVFSRESQFWPGVYQNYMEAGLGQMTENGADGVLLWNPGFFEQFCPLILDQDVCKLGYGNLNTANQELLQGALVNEVNATCLDCPIGINLSQANFSVSVFAESLQANCVQTAQIVYNLTKKSPGSQSSYEDLWRFTLVNYNAGPGCLSDAIERTQMFGQSLSWENVSSNLEGICRFSIDYVDTVSTAPQLQPTPTPWLQVDSIVPPEYDPLPTQTPVPTPTPEPAENSD